MSKVNIRKFREKTYLIEIEEEGYAYRKLEVSKPELKKIILYGQIIIKE